MNWENRLLLMLYVSTIRGQLLGLHCVQKDMTHTATVIPDKDLEVNEGLAEECIVLMALIGDMETAVDSMEGML